MPPIFKDLSHIKLKHTKQTDSRWWQHNWHIGTQWHQPWYMSIIQGDSSCCCSVTMTTDESRAAALAPAKQALSQKHTNYIRHKGMSMMTLLALVPKFVTSVSKMVFNLWQRCIFEQRPFSCAVGAIHFLVEKQTRRIKLQASLMWHCYRMHMSKRQQKTLHDLPVFEVCPLMCCVVHDSLYWARALVRAAARQMRTGRAWPATAQRAGWDPAGLEMCNISTGLNKITSL